MRWQAKTREVCLKYRQNCKELKAGNITKGGVSFAVGKNNRAIAKPVERAVEQLGDDAYFATLQREKQAVEWAIKVLERIEGDPKSRSSAREQAKLSLEIATLVYVKGSHTILQSAQEIHCSRESAYRYHSAFIKLVAAKMGYIKI